jgi:hypothetical protein
LDAAAILYQIRLASLVKGAVGTGTVDTKQRKRKAWSIVLRDVTFLSARLEIYSVGGPGAQGGSISNMVRSRSGRSFHFLYFPFNALIAPVGFLAKSEDPRDDHFFFSLTLLD